MKKLFYNKNDLLDIPMCYNIKLRAESPAYPYNCWRLGLKYEKMKLNRFDGSTDWSGMQGPYEGP